jgi:diguanylate cyclase (GGDEF)-like protein
MEIDAAPPILSINATILLGSALSFFIVNYRYPDTIRRSLNLYAFAGIAIAAGALSEAFFKVAAPLPSQMFNLIVSGGGTCLYYFSYRCLQERSYHGRMVAALFAAFVASVFYGGLVAHNANLNVFAICVLDAILFGLASRDLLVNMGGRGRAHLIQGVGMGLFAALLLAWGAQLLTLPPKPQLIIHFGDPESYGLALTCLGSAIGSINFLLLCNDEFNARLLTLAETDELTGLANRRRLIERGRAEIARARRFGHPVTAMMIDLDHFKALNDTHGHAAGDRALKQVADVCRDTLRDIDLVARSGGEEFAVLLPETDLAKGLEVAERLRHAIYAIELPVGPDGARIAASVGIAELGKDEAVLDQLLARADKALYRAKAEGRNRVCCEMSVAAGASAEANPA